MSSNNSRQNNFRQFSPNGGAWKRPPATQQQPEKLKSSPKHDSHKKQVVLQLSELFGKVLDPEIISSVASNCCWNVDAAIEALIEISKDANVPVPSQTNSIRGNTRLKDDKLLSPSSIPALKAIKIAYQGYDDSSDDADLLVEEEEEFEVVMKVTESLPLVGNHISRGSDQKTATEAKKIRKVSHSPTVTAIHESVSRGIKILVLMRGAPGCGKSYMARQVLKNSLNADPNLYIFSTDDFFSRNGRYIFEPQMLPEAHDWNRQRVNAVMHKGQSPVFIDNTNTQSWEMKPYLHLATHFGYAIELLEPNTPWCWKEAELAQRNSHGVTRHSIRGMLERYEKCNVGQLLRQFNLKYAYGNIPPQRCTNPPKPKNVNLHREANRTQKKKEVQPIPALIKPVVSGLDNGGLKVGDEAGYYGLLPNSPVPAQNSSSNIIPQINEPTLHPIQLLLEEIEPMQQVSPIKIIKEIRTEGMEQFLSKLPLEINVQKLVHVEQAMKEQTRDESRDESRVVAIPKNSDQTLEVPLSQLEKDTPVNATNPNNSTGLPLDLQLMKEKIQACLTSRNYGGSKDSSRGCITAANQQVSEDGKLDLLDQEIDDEMWEEFLNHKVCDNVQVSLPEEVIAELANPLEAVSIIDGAISPCWEYSLVNSDNVTVHQKHHDNNKTENIAHRSADGINCNYSTDDIASHHSTDGVVCHLPTDDVDSQSLNAQMSPAAPATPYMETLTNIEKVMDRLPSLNLCTDQMSTYSSIEQSDEVFIPEQPIKGDEVKETLLPKLNLFSWLFPKKLPDMRSPESSIQSDGNVAREPWQLYRPRDVETINSNSLLLERCKMESNDSETLALSEVMETLEEVREISLQKINQPCDPAESLPSEVIVDCNMMEAVNVLDSSVEPISFLLDAADVVRNEDVILAINTVSQETHESDEMVIQLVGSNSLTQVTNQTSDSKQNADFDSIADINVELVDDSTETLEDITIEKEQAVSEEALINQSVSIAETRPKSTSVDDESDVNDTVKNNSDMNLSDVGICSEPIINVTEECIPDISSNINVHCWAKLNPMYVLSEEGAQMIPLQLKATEEVTTKQREVRDCGTNTAHSDFSSVDHNLPVLTACNRSINVGATVNSLRPVASVYMLDKGSMTTVDLEPGQYDFELLVNMFPKIPKDDLMEVFQKCQQEINWTVDVLLESGYAFEPSEDLEIRFGNTEELQHTQDLLEELNSRDLTFIKPDLVQSSLEAHSDSPKKYTQLEDFKMLIDSQLSGFDMRKEGSNTSTDQSASVSVESASSSQSKKMPKKQSKLTLQLKKQMENSFVLSEDSYSEETLRIKKIRHGEIQPIARTDLSNLNFNEQNYELPKLPESRPDSADMPDMELEEEEEGCLQLTLDSEFLVHLQLLFGDVAFAYPEGVSPVVDLPISLARQIHGYLMESQQQQLEKQEAYFESMIKDEEFARRLQEEELPPPDLRQIMDMEMALELYRTDASNQRRETKEDMATRLSKQKLYELFPNLDREVLSDVFAAHDYSFTETLLVLEASTGQPEEAVRNVMSPEALLALEKQLIDKAKQESNKQSEVCTQEETCTDGISYSAANQKELAIDNGTYYREEANRLVQLRNECYQKANHAHRNNQAAVASYYAQVGHLYKQRIEAANSRAASALLSAQAQRSTTLDLHYLYVAEALQALDIFLDHHIACLADNGNKTESLYIITGKGLHSVGGKPRIRPAVQTRLGERKVRFVNVNSGLLKVTITRNLMLSNGAK